MTASGSRGMEAPPIEGRGRRVLAAISLVILGDRLEGLQPRIRVLWEGKRKIPDRASLVRDDIYGLLNLRGLGCTRALNASINGHQGKHPVQSATHQRRTSLEPAEDIPAFVAIFFVFRAKPVKLKIKNHSLNRLPIYSRRFMISL